MAAWEPSLQNSCFWVQSPSSYDSCYCLSTPIEIGQFSINGDGIFSPDDSERKFLSLRNYGKMLDLNEGFNAAVLWRTEHRSRRIDNLLRWILSNAHNSRPNTTRYDFILKRSALGVFGCGAHPFNDLWQVLATKFQGTIYLTVCEAKTPQSQSSKARTTLMSYWGQKFEQYMTSNGANGEPDTRSPVNQNSQYHVVLTSKIKHHSLLYSAEIDAIEASGSSVKSHSYVELKTSVAQGNYRSEMTVSRYKVLPWWIQSSLANVSKIICGFRDGSGLVTDFETYHVNDLPRLSGDWFTPQSVSNLWNRILDFVKTVVVKDDPKVVYVFSVASTTGNARITYEEFYDPPNHYQVLPAWYTARF